MRRLRNGRCRKAYARGQRTCRQCHQCDHAERQQEAMRPAE
ncbi:hypothetical protein L842_4368 [Mycobacterium intracellulare MIN_052511_1280]|nr:hypothetical protein L842_4368 [Mycobacterium intracellulare MIN_052511_1280]